MSDLIEAEAIRRPIRDRLAARVAQAREDVILACVARGADRAEAEAQLEELESDRPILDWLLAGGLERLITLILTLIGRG